MRTLHLILYIIAALCFAVAFIVPGAVRRDDTTTGGGFYRLNLVAAGLLAWVLVPLTALIDQ